MTRELRKFCVLASITLCISAISACESSSAPPTPVCPSTNGETTSPTTITEAVAMANGMLAAGSQPVTLPCFLERLDRPLSAMGVLSIFSLQPAVGRRSPRIFLFSGNLVMSVVPDGIARDFLEFAEYTTPTRSIKAEVHFPVQTPIPPAEPYDRIRESASTVCGGCHRSETAAPQVSVAQGFESDVLRPRAVDIVPLSSLFEETRTCDPAIEPQRCEMLNAIFRKGEVVPGSFSSDANTIYY